MHIVMHIVPDTFAQGDVLQVLVVALLTGTALVDLDLEKFFDRVNHDISMGLVAKRVTDKRILKLIRGFLTDDCNIYVRSQRAGEWVRASVERFLTKRLKLTGNKAKSAVAEPHTRKFLGFSFTNGTNIKRRLAPQTVVRFKAKVRELTRRTRGRSLAQIVKELSVYLIGGRGALPLAGGGTGNRCSGAARGMSRGVVHDATQYAAWRSQSEVLS